jgi:acetamidase/formamidase
MSRPACASMPGLQYGILIGTRRWRREVLPPGSKDFMLDKLRCHRCPHQSEVSMLTDREAYSDVSSWLRRPARRRLQLLATLALSLSPLCASAAEFALMPSPQTVHIGHFNAALKPVLTINSGDTVTIETATQIDPAEVDRSGVVPPSAVPEYTRTIFREVKDRGPGAHILSGPIFINGAEPGDVLEVRIQRIELATDYGYNVQRPYLGALPTEFPGVFQRVIKIDRTAKRAEIAPGVIVPVERPFFGTLGVAPIGAAGRISSGPPGVHTGNLDNKDIAAGTTLYMPVYVNGALFSVGDGHAAQGHGEVDLSAIETGLRGTLQFIVRKDMKISWPRAENATSWIVMGLDPSLDEAMKIAVRETINLITEKFPRLSRQEAYMIASIAVDYHVTQVVDGTKGIHGMIPKAIFASQ